MAAQPQVRHWFVYVKKKLYMNLLSLLRPPQANSYTVSTVTAPSWLHRFIIGKKGQNLAKITQLMPKVGTQDVASKLCLDAGLKINLIGR